MGFLDNKRRRYNYRTQISPTERVIGVVILLLLAGIAVAVYIKGQHYDPRLFTLDASVLERKAEAAPTVASVDTTTGEATVESPRQTGSGILPPPLEGPLEGWKLMDPVEYFNAENLYVKIDGRAEQYLAYDVVGLETVSLVHESNPDLFLDIFIFDMGTPTNAFGIFSTERSPGESLDIGDEGYLSGPSLFFRKGRYYNQIIAAEDTPEVLAAIQAVARWIDQSQKSEDTAIALVDQFPNQDRVADSDRYFKTDALGLSFLTDVYATTYRVNGVEVTAFLTRRTSVEEAQQLFQQYKEYMQRYGQPLPTKDVDGTTLLVADMGGFYDAVFQKGNYLGGVNFVSDREAAETVAARLVRSVSE